MATDALVDHIEQLFAIAREMFQAIAQLPLPPGSLGVRPGGRRCPDPGGASRALEPLAGLLGLSPRAVTTGRLTDQLRRLRLHGLIARLPGTHRYRVTDRGLRTALFFTRVHVRLFRPGLALVLPDATADDASLRRAFVQLERAMDHWCAEAKLAA